MPHGSSCTRVPPISRRARSNTTVVGVSSLGGGGGGGGGSGRPPRLSIPVEPPKVPRRPPSKGNKRETLADIAKRIPLQLMRAYFNYPLRTAAEAMHISVTTLKRLCRRHGVKRWPHRQISGINRALSDLESQHDIAGEGEVGAAIADQLRHLHRRREIVIELAFESDEETGRTSFSRAPPPPPPVAHRRGHRGSASSSDCSYSSAPSSPRSRSSSISIPASPSGAPESPGSPIRLNSGKPTAMWWQHTPGVDNSLASTATAMVNGCRATSSTASGEICGGGAIRRPLASGRGRTLGNGNVAGGQRSSAVFGNIPRPNGGATAAGIQHRRSIGSERRLYSASPPPPSPSPLPLSLPSHLLGSTGGGVSGGGCCASDGMGALNLASTTSTSAEVEEAVMMTTSLTGINNNNTNTMFEHQTGHVKQQMDDLAALGELLFGPEDPAAASATTASTTVIETREQGAGGALHGGDVFPSSSSHWAPSVSSSVSPRSSSVLFSQHQGALGAAAHTDAFSAAQEQSFASGLASAPGWRAPGSDRSGSM